MKRSIQEYVELAIFGLIAAFVGTALLWLVGWVVRGLGWLLQMLAGLLWFLLKFILPVAIILIAGYVVYIIWRNRSKRQPHSEPATVVGANGSTMRSHDNSSEVTVVSDGNVSSTTKTHDSGQAAASDDVSKDKDVSSSADAAKPSSASNAKNANDNDKDDKKNT